MNATIYNKQMSENIINMALDKCVPSYQNLSYVDFDNIIKTCWELNHEMIEKWLCELFLNSIYFLNTKIIFQIGNDSDIYMWKNKN
jgi:hypothetical protein